MHLFLVIPIFAVSVAVTAIITYFVTRHVYEKQMFRFQDSVLKKQRDEVENVYNTMRGWRHDYHNHIQTIKAHLAMNRLKELKTYLDHLEEDLDSIDIAIRTGNTSVNAILSSKVSIAQKNQINVSCKATVPPRPDISDVHLCTIIGNLLDNAIESCQKVEGGHRFIRIYIGMFREQLYISVTNSTSQTARKKMSELLTAKKGEHGMGLKRIDKIVSQYGGYVNRKNEPGVFATEVML